MALDDGFGYETCQGPFTSGGSKYNHKNIHPKTQTAIILNFFQNCKIKKKNHKWH